LSDDVTDIDILGSPSERRAIFRLPRAWSKDFLEAGKKRLAGDTARAATSDEVKGLRREATALKEVVADLTLENRLLKKSVTADGEDEA
jgi:transposase